MSDSFFRSHESADYVCHPSEVALKSFFLGPQAENAPWLTSLLLELLEHWFSWRENYFPEDGGAVSTKDREQELFKDRQHHVRNLALDLMKRYESEVPKFSPRYIGHMFSEISMPALIGHIISLLHNPNIISSESAVVGVQIESEAIIELIKMVGFDPKSSSGHFTSGGTVANYEALLRAQERSSAWMARGLLTNRMNYVQAAHQGWVKFVNTQAQPEELSFQWSRVNPWTLGPRFLERTKVPFAGAVTLVPRNKHYSWIKAVRLLGLGDESCWQIALNSQGRMSIPALRDALCRAERENRPILMVVSVAGTTEMGEVDAVDEVQDLLDEWKLNKKIEIWHHVDGAYGAFFRTLGGSSPDGLKPDVWSALQAFDRVNSITIDPHKLGYVPYACGAILVRHAEDYRIYCHDAPYIQYNAAEDRGKFTLEGSRSAGGATATWLTAKSIGLHAQGYGLILARTLRIRKQMVSNLRASKLAIQIAPDGDTNVLCFHAAKDGEAISQSNARTERLYQKFMLEPAHNFFVSKTILNTSDYSAYLEKFTSQWSAEVDDKSLILIRLCLMNPFFGSQVMKTDFHETWIQCIRSNLQECE